MNLKNSQKSLRSSNPSEVIDKMIKANETHKDSIIGYLMKEPDINLFIMGDIENYGLNFPELEIWIERNADGVSAILMRFYDSLVFSASGEDFDKMEFANLIKSLDHQVLSGQEEALAILDDQLEYRQRKSMNLSRLSKETYHSQNLSCHENLKKFSLRDTDSLIALRETIEEFESSPNRELIESEFEQGFARGYCVVKDGKMLSMAQTSAENSRSAMVVGVCTHKEHRGKGLANQCLHKLCQEVLSEGKNLCLFYDNPIAAEMYIKMGFKDIAKWRMNVR